MASMILSDFTLPFMASEILSTSLLNHKGEHFQLKKLRKPLDKWHF